MAMEKQYTVLEAADACRVTRRTVMRWLADGKITAKKVGRKWLIPTSELVRVLAGAIAEENPPRPYKSKKPKSVNRQ